MIQIHKKALISSILTIVGSILSIYVIIELLFYLSNFIDFRLAIGYLFFIIILSSYILIALSIIYCGLWLIYDSFVEYYNKKELKGE
jgi:hypothetical protein